MTSPHDGDGDEGSAGEPEPPVRARCGVRADGPRPAWTLSAENGVRLHCCERCSREDLRAIEGRLDSQWR
ncbi:hypothetical protein [Streptomyces sp. NPDC096105]|uniref:hypothetical protein n=1 Tax=Streptomyces sp. NPDC096105 TaxID=3366074 RepID=UPI00381CA386